MCLVLDANVFGAFFDPTNAAHDDLKPALEWVVYGKGRLVYGGTKYKSEMRAAGKYLKLFANLQRAGKIVSICDKSVDTHEAKITGLEKDSDFDDPHLIAIVVSSGCKIVCTNDKRALPYLKKAALYQGIVKRPKIYQSKRNAALLADENIAEVCCPCKKLSKKAISNLTIQTGK